MRTRTRTIALAAIGAAMIASAVSVFAHPATYKGTVISVEMKTLHVKVIDDTTKKESTMIFEVTPTTKVYRGDKTVKYADAHILKDERVAVTIDHDEPGEKAVEIRLAAAK
jgi:hypothetical protein